MVLPDTLSRENIVGTILAGVAIAIMIVWQYMKERKNPTSPSGDRVIPGMSIADMRPFTKIAEALERTAEADERVAAGVEAILKLLRDQAQDEALEEKIGRLVSQLDEREDGPRRRRGPRD